MCLVWAILSYHWSMFFVPALRYGSREASAIGSCAASVCGSRCRSFGTSLLVCASRVVDTDKRMRTCCCVATSRPSRQHCEWPCELSPESVYL